MLGLEVPKSPMTCVVTRMDYHSMPGVPYESGEYVTSTFGRSGPRTITAGLLSALVGIRVHAPTRRLCPFLDAMFGVGIVGLEGVSVPLQVTSLGGGLRFAPGGVVGVFIDAHYDVFGHDFSAPILPIRTGLTYP